MPRSIKSNSGFAHWGMFFIIVIAGALVVGALWFLRPKPQMHPVAPSTPPVVTVINAAPQEWQAHIRTQGTVQPVTQINLTAEVGGRITVVSDQFAEGGFFEAQEVLVMLDDRDYQAALISAQATLADAQRALALEKGEARQAKREWRDLGSAEANALFLREPQGKAALANAAAAKAQRDQALLNIERTQMSAPFAGVVGSVLVNVGQFIAPGTAIGTVYDRTTFEVRLPLTDSQLALTNLVPGVTIDPDSQPSVTLKAEIAGQPHQWPAKLVRIEPTVEASTRFYYATVEVEDPLNSSRYSQPLLAGLFVEALLPGKIYKQVIALPEKALLNRQLFAVDENNQVVAKPVQVLESRDQKVWVVADITAGEKVIVSDPRVLKPGLTVSPVQQESR